MTSSAGTTRLPPSTAGALRRGSRRGFTIVELSVVIVIIGVLVSILLITLGKVFRSTEEIGAERQLRAIADAISQFETDMGYFPPLLAPDDATWALGDPAPTDSARRLVVVPESLAGNTSTARLRQTRYGSEYSLAVYLLGAGDLNGRVGEAGSSLSTVPNPGANNEHDDGAPGPGFRNPGPDRSWGGATDREKNNPTKFGRSYGPYLDQSTLQDQLVVEPESGLFKILDPWGQPVRYYTGWPTVDATSKATTVARVPVELRSAEAVQAQIDEMGKANLELDRPALASQFMLVSAGRPTEFGADTKPLPTFGERKQTDRAVQIQNLQNDFDPSTLSVDEQEYLVSRLESNIRVNQ